MTVQPPDALRLARTADLAGDPGVTIADFMFSPGTITVHAGDTITWTNNGPSSHTATATNGSFDTGTLRKGASGSHTFTQAGSYTYFCKIHPFMHGTIVVLAATTSAAPKPGSTPAKSSPPNRASTATTTKPNEGSARSPATKAPSTGGPTLPMTGANLVTSSLAGLLLLAVGLTLRRGPFR